MEEYTSSTPVECCSLEESFLFMTSDGKNLHKEITGDIAALNGQFSVADSVKDLVMVKGYNEDLHRQIINKYKSYFYPCFIGNPYPVTVKIKGVSVTSYCFLTVGIYKNKIYKMKTMMASDIAKLVGIKELLFSSILIPKDVITYAIKNANPNFSLKISKRSISSTLTGLGYRENTAFNNAILNFTSQRFPTMSAKMVGTPVQNIIQFKEK